MGLASVQILNFNIYESGAAHFSSVRLEYIVRAQKLTAVLAHYFVQDAAVVIRLLGGHHGPDAK
jgi:hypothetical protein